MEHFGSSEPPGLDAPSPDTSAGGATGDRVPLGLRNSGPGGRVRQRLDIALSTRTSPASYSMLQCARPSPPGAGGVRRGWRTSARWSTLDDPSPAPAAAIPRQNGRRSHTNRYNRQDG